MSARPAIEQALRDILGRKGIGRPITDDMPIFGAGLDSLDFAELVARLEETLGVDPFAAAFTPQNVSTLARLIEIYEHAARDPG